MNWIRKIIHGISLRFFYGLIFSPREKVQYKLLFSNWVLTGYNNARLKRHREEDTLTNSWFLSLPSFYRAILHTTSGLTTSTARWISWMPPSPIFLTPTLPCEQGKCRNLCLSFLNLFLMFSKAQFHILVFQHYPGQCVHSVVLYNNTSNWWTFIYASSC